MPRRPFKAYEDPRTKEIDELKRTVRRLRHQLVRMAPQELRTTLQGYRGCETWQQLLEWERNAIDAIVEAAVVIPEASYFEKRALCPLCGGESSGPYDRGYKIPGGLEWHLTGHGRTASCPVFDAAKALADDYCHPKLEQQEQSEAEALVRRRNTETLYRVHARGEPELVDGRTIYGRAARDVSDLATVGERLSALGFEKKVEGNIIEYRYDQGDALVLADPRIAGRLDFEVSPKLARKGKRYRQTTQFYLLDGWKDQEGKFLERLAKARADLGLPPAIA